MKDPHLIQIIPIYEKEPALQENRKRAGLVLLFIALISLDTRVRGYDNNLKRFMTGFYAAHGVHLF